MARHLCVSIRFLDAAFHGRGDGNLAEWPPSPLRLFQSLVAVAALKQKELESVGRYAEALKWLEKMPPPEIAAPPVHIGIPVRLAVPNNDLDTIASAWAKGLEPKKQPSELRTMKTMRTIWLLGSEAVHYLWPLPDGFAGEVQEHIGTIREIARSVFAVGWGIDVAIGDNQILNDHEVARLNGQRWLACGDGGGNSLRLPKPGTFDALLIQYRQFVERLTPQGFNQPESMTCFDHVAYRRSTDSQRSSMATFALLKTDGSGFRGFDTGRCALAVAGMVRHAARRAAQRVDWPEDQINRFILGHGLTSAGAEHTPVGPRRFTYLPLPSIERRGEGRTVVGSVRRIALCAFSSGVEEEVAWARQALSGEELVEQNSGQAVALLSLIPTNDRMVRRYTEPAGSWVTVTPVVLPGYDDPAHYRRRLRKTTAAEEQQQLLGRLSDRIDGLLRKAIVQAGFSSALADQAEIEWRKTGFLAGVEHAERYGVPDHLRRFPRYHVRISWRDEKGQPIKVSGPICLGGGRFYGVGLFVRDDSAFAAK